MGAWDAATPLGSIFDFGSFRGCRRFAPHAPANRVNRYAVSEAEVRRIAPRSGGTSPLAYYPAVWRGRRVV